MRAAPTCPRCGATLHPPNPWSSSWICDGHGAVNPLQPILRPSAEGLDVLLRVARVPVWLPWPLPDRWLVTGYAHAGDDRTGARASAVACSGPAVLFGGPADMILVGEEPGVGLGARYAGLDGPDPGGVFDARPPDAKVAGQGRLTSLWSVSGAADRAVFVGEAMGRWLWILMWPPEAGMLLLEPLALIDLRETGHALDLPYGARCPRLAQ